MERAEGATEESSDEASDLSSVLALRAIGGEVCVRFVVDHPRPLVKSRWGGRKGKEREQALVVGLPSFEETAAWFETRIETVEGASPFFVSSPTVIS